MADANHSELPTRVALGVIQTWRRLAFDQRLAAVGALLLIVSTFGPFSFVEGAILLTAFGVLILLHARVRGRDFHVPFGDGAVIAAAGAWSALLILVRLFNRPLGQGLLALVCAAILIAAGVREHGKRAADDLDAQSPADGPAGGSAQVPPARAATDVATPSTLSTRGNPPTAAAPPAPAGPAAPTAPPAPVAPAAAAASPAPVAPPAAAASPPPAAPAAPAAPPAADASPAPVAPAAAAAPPEPAAPAASAASAAQASREEADEGSPRNALTEPVSPDEPVRPHRSENETAEVNEHDPADDTTAEVGSHDPAEAETIEVRRDTVRDPILSEDETEPIVARLNTDGAEPPTPRQPDLPSAAELSDSLGEPPEFEPPTRTSRWRSRRHRRR